MQRNKIFRFLDLPGNGFVADGEREPYVLLIFIIRKNIRKIFAFYSDLFCLCMLYYLCSH